MKQQQQQSKLTKKVIIVNQKSNVINENVNIMNKEQSNNVDLQLNNQNILSIPKIEFSSFQDNSKYIQEMMILYQKNSTQLKEFEIQIQDLKQRVTLIEQKFQEIEQSQKKKKKRRTAAEIDKNFKCPYTNCEKQYGSDVSLNLHIKFKHNGGNKSERQKILKQLQTGEIQESDIVNINLPPI